MEQNKIIKEKLAALGEDYDALKPFMKAHLERVETFIQNKRTKQIEALLALREAEYNVSEIAKELEYSRTTLYNHNQLLKRYIEYSIEQDNKKNPVRIAEDIKASKQKLQEQVDLMQNRDVDFELLKHENSVLVDTITEKDKEIERMRIRIQELSEELHQYKMKTPRGIIVNINNQK